MLALGGLSDYRKFSKMVDSGKSLIINIIILRVALNSFYGFIGMTSSYQEGVRRRNVRF